ncbi:MAG: ABC transporter substrate-binding protein [Candidatus Velthaea sp.]
MIAGLTLGAPPALAAQEPIKLGVMLSLSGPAAVFGIPERNAIEAIAESINKSGGVNGRKLQLIVMDDMTNPTEAARSVTQLINGDKVVAIVGPGTGGGILAAGPVAERGQTPLLGPAGTVAITDKKNSFYPWIFRVAPDDVVDIKMILTDAVKHGAKKIGIIYQEDAYGKAGVDFAQGLVPALGLTIVSVVSAALNATDLTPEATKLRDAKPDSIFMQVSISAMGASFVKAAHQVGINVPIYTNAGLAQKSFIDALGGTGDGTRVLSIGNLPYDPSPGEKKLADMLTKAGKTPQGWGELVGSNGLMTAVAAMKSIKGPISGVTMQKALETLCGFETYARGKPCYSNGSHDAWGTDSLVITQVKDGKLITQQ